MNQRILAMAVRAMMPYAGPSMAMSMEPDCVRIYADENVRLAVQFDDLAAEIRRSIEIPLPAASGVQVMAIYACCLN